MRRTRARQDQHATIAVTQNFVAHYPAKWARVRELPPLGAREIQVCLVDFSAMSRAAPDELNCDERRRATRLQHAQKRKLYADGRVALRRLLRRHVELPNAALRFTQGARGKPALANPDPRGELQFNYSVSGGKGLYAFAWNREVGVDLELLPRAINAERLARRKLSCKEQRALFALPRAQQHDAALACWTRKESYGKAVGVGMRYHLNRAPLFEKPHEYHWQTEVVGLFARDDAPPTMLHGLQLALPFAGVAALMYAAEQPLNIEKHLSTFVCDL